jgi:hypothetical protein
MMFSSVTAGLFRTCSANLLKAKKLKYSRKLFSPSLQASRGQAVKALTRILKTEAFFEDLLTPKPAQGVPDSSWRKIGLADQLLLCQRTILCQDIKDLPCGWRKIIYNIEIRRTIVGILWSWARIPGLTNMAGTACRRTLPSVCP